MTAAAAIAGGFLLWAVIHSVLASRWMKALARDLIGEGTRRWYRLFFVTFATITLAPILAGVALLPDRQLYRVAPPWRWLMVLGQVGALSALLVSVLQAGVWHFLGIAQLTADDPRRTGELQVRGLYRYVRHPLYLFSILLIWLTPVMTLNLAVLYACMTGYFILGSFHEEDLLVQEYGESYVRYRRQVPRFVPVPGRVYDAGPG